MIVGFLIAGGLSADELVAGLQEAGVDIRVQTTHSLESPSISAATAGSLLEKVCECDLLHNLAGGLGLLLANMAGKPVITSLARSLGPDDLAIFRAASSSSFFVSEPGDILPEGLKTIPGLEACDGDKVRFYLDAYTRILAFGKRREERPWGSFEILSDDHGNHKVKRIVVRPGKRLSLQYHGRRREHWIIISGEALVTVGEDKVKLEATEAIDIPRGKAHRVENMGLADLVFIEVQQGDYFGEDDIVRIEDDFGRS